MYKIPYPSNPISLNLQNLPLFIVHVVALLVIKYDLCTLVQIGGLFQSYKLRGISRYVSRYGPPYRGRGTEIRRGTHPYRKSTLAFIRHCSRVGGGGMIN